MIITNKDLWGHNDKYEVVDKIPANYIVWNIGDNMINNYLPLCEVEDDGMHIKRDTLKAIKFDDVEELKIMRDGAAYGVTDLKNCKRLMNRKNPKSYRTKKSKALAEQAITIFERLTEGQ